jgi:hypothetical protein
MKKHSFYKNPNRKFVMIKTRIAIIKLKPGFLVIQIMGIVRIIAKTSGRIKCNWVSTKNA